MVEEADRTPDTSPAQGTPPIGDDAEKGQTQTPAPQDDVGVPDDEEMGTPPEDESD